MPHTRHEKSNHVTPSEKRKNKNRLLTIGVPLVALGAVAMGMLGIKTTSAISHEVEVPGTAVSVSGHEHEANLEGPALAAYEIAHRYDNGCAIKDVADMQQASEMLPDAMKDKTTVMVNMTLSRSEAAEKAMQKYMYDDTVMWIDPMKVTATTSANMTGGRVPANSVEGSEFGVNEQQDLTVNSDGSYNLRLALYLPNQLSNDDKPPVSFELTTQAFHDRDVSTMQESVVGCEGAIVNKDGVWQLGE